MRATEEIVFWYHILCNNWSMQEVCDLQSV